jgi:integrase
MLLYLLAFSGLRRGEAFALRWDDIDVEAGQLHVNRAVYQGAIGAPKTKRSARTVDLPQPLVDRLAIYKRSYPPIGVGYVFRTAAGTMLDPDDLHKRTFTPLAVKAGLRPATTEDAADGELFGVHVLRHTYASMLIASGVSFDYVSRMLGHGNIGITLSVYTHLLRETSVSAMGRLAMRMPIAAAPNEEEGAA